MKSLGCRASLPDLLSTSLVLSLDWKLVLTRFFTLGFWTAEILLLKLVLARFWAAEMPMFKLVLARFFALVVWTAGELLLFKLLLLARLLTIAIWTTEELVFKLVLTRFLVPADRTAFALLFSRIRSFKGGVRGVPCCCCCFCCSLGAEITKN